MQKEHIYYTEEEEKALFSPICYGKGIQGGFSMTAADAEGSVLKVDVEAVYVSAAAAWSESK